MGRPVRGSSSSLVFTILFAMIVAAAGALELFSRHLATRDEGGVKVGVFRVRENDVRRKAHSELAWRRSLRESSVYNHDRVFTGSDSVAEIDLVNGTRVMLKPNSLVQISMPEAETKSPERGLFARLFDEAPEAPASSSLSSNPASLEATPPAMVRVQVLSGEAEVQTATAPARSVKTDESATVSSAEVAVAATRPPAVAGPVEVQIVAVASEGEIRRELSFATPAREPSSPVLPPETQAPAPEARADVPTPETVTTETVAPQTEIVETPPPPRLIPTPSPEPVNQPLRVEDETPPRTETDPAPLSAKELPSKARAWVWLGVGANYQYFSQNVPELGKATFQNIHGPALALAAGFQGESWGLDLSYKETPGLMKSSSSATIEGGTYKWKTLGSEVLYRSSEQSVWGYRFGLQSHVLPFMVRDSQSTVIRVGGNSITMLSAGFDRRFLLSDRLSAEWQMRYQYPVLTGAENGAQFSVAPKVIFDGSVGSFIAVADRTRLGIFWYGQMQQFRFNYKNDVLSFEGEQTSFYSNLELRLGLEF